MEWKKLLTVQRKVSHEDKEHLKYITEKVDTSEFDYDYRRIIQSASFRRLQDKTQVFPLDNEDFVRTRLTHSIEVSSIASTLGKLFVENTQKYYPKSFCKEMEEIPTILSAAALIHDLGNPPFGHYGEHVIQSWFKNNISNYEFEGKQLFNENKETGEVSGILTKQQAYDFFMFDGNAQTFRIINRLHFDRGGQGLNLTFPVLGAIGKYTTASHNADKKSGLITEKKIGYFYSEEEFRFEISEVLGTTIDGVIARHPLAFLIEAADDIAYRLSDLEDLFKKHLVSLNDLIKFIENKIEEYRPQEIEQSESYQRVEYILKSLKRIKKENPHSDEYNIINEWLFEVQMFLINAASYSFTYKENYNKIMNGAYNYDLFYGTFHETTIRILGDIAKEFAFLDAEVNLIELSSKSILEYLLETFVPVLIKYDSSEKMSLTENKILSMISENYLQSYQAIKQEVNNKNISEDEKKYELVYHRIFTVVDYISGMTDRYSKNLYNRLTGHL